MIRNKNSAGSVLCVIGKRSAQAEFKTLSFGFFEVDWRSVGLAGFWRLLRARLEQVYI